MIKVKKILLTATALSLSMFANANAKDINDPLYLLGKGSFMSESIYSYAKSTNATFNNTGTVAYTSKKTKTHKLQEAISYGVTDKFQLGLQFAYSPSEEARSNNGTSITKIQNKGFYDPSFDIKYRLVDDNAYTLDILGYYKSNVIDWTESVTGSRNGAPIGGFGGNSYGLGAKLGKDYGNYTVTAYAIAIYNEDSNLKRKEASSESYYNISDSMDYEFGIESQYRFNEQYNVNLDLSYLEKGKFDSTSLSTSRYVAISGGDTFTAKMKFNYNIDSSSSVGLFASYSRLDDLYQRSDAFPNMSTFVEEEDTHEIGVSYKKVF